MGHTVVSWSYSLGKKNQINQNNKITKLIRKYEGKVQTKIITLQEWLKSTHTSLEWYKVDELWEPEFTDQADSAGISASVIPSVSGGILAEFIFN